MTIIPINNTFIPTYPRRNYLLPHSVLFNYLALRSYSLEFVVSSVLLAAVS
jgi:hypothetical protein